MPSLDIPTPDPRLLDDDARPFAEAVADRYALKREIGRGGMGIVYLARDKRLERLVAIKTLPPHLAKDPGLRERFLRESRTAGQLSHPHVVPIHGADEVGGHVYFVMPYVDGESLAAKVMQRGRLAPDAVVRYLRDVASALAHAHAHGIVHRDVKAENILVERATDRALVTDFGIARLAEATPLTVTGQVLGTVYYVSPEQVAGDHVDARSDLYSLGVVGYLALTGRFPHEGSLASAVLVSHVTRHAPPVAAVDPTIPPALATIIDRCLARDPGHRHASAEALIAALDAATPLLDARPVRVTDTEAHQVWKRAAELQAQTGIVPRPEPLAKARDPERDARNRSGLAVDEIRAAGQEAGIADPYIAHALMEAGLLPGGRKPAKATPVQDPVLERGNPLTGVPHRIVREAVVEGELPPQDVERLLNLVRDVTGRMGETLAKTRELGWWSGVPGRRLSVFVVPEHGRTTIRVVRNRRLGAIAGFLASIPVLGMAGGAIVGTILHEGFGMPEEFAVLLGLGTGLYFVFGLGRRLLRGWHRRVARGVEALAERLTARVRASIGEPR